MESGELTGSPTGHTPPTFGPGSSLRGVGMRMVDPWSLTASSPLIVHKGRNWLKKYTDHGFDEIITEMWEKSDGESAGED